MMIICKLSATNMTRRLWWNVLPHNLLEGVTKAFVGPDMRELFLAHYQNPIIEQKLFPK